MDCSRCGEPIDLDLLLCRACGHDMLPQDISRGPFTNGARTANSERQSTDAVLAAEPGRVRHDVATESPEDRADHARRMRRDYWRIAVFLAMMIGAEFVFSIL